MRLRAAMGKIVPPIDEPMAFMPRARPRLRLNQWPMMPIMGPKMMPHANCRELINLRNETRSEGNYAPP